MLLSSTEFSNKVESAFVDAEDNIIVLSAFIKANALKWMLKDLKAKSIKVIARWRKHDLICGVSDFEVYQICKEANVDFGISLNLHGKVFCIDNQIFVGSANLTSRGMALTNGFNDEFGVGFEAGDADREKVTSYLQNVTWINDGLVNKIKLEIESSKNEQNLNEQIWSDKLNEHLSKPIKYLWIHELLFAKPTDLLNFDSRNINHRHDLELLNLGIDDLNIESLIRHFKRSNSYRWLQSILSEVNSLSFGAVSAKLHSAILDDPSPYRRDIKILVANLYAWFEILPTEYEIQRPRHSKVIKRIKN